MSAAEPKNGNKQTYATSGFSAEAILQGADAIDAIPSVNPVSATPRVVIGLVDGSSRDVVILRATRRRASRQHCPWRLVMVEDEVVPSTLGHPEEERLSARRYHALSAERQGAVVDTVHQICFRTELTKLVERLQAEQPGLQIQWVVSGALAGQVTSRRLEINLPEFLQALVQGDATSVQRVEVDIDVNAVPALPRFMGMGDVHVSDVLQAIFAVILAMLLIEGMELFLPLNEMQRSGNRPVVFMIACAVAAGRLGLIPGLVAALGSFISLTYFYPGAHSLLKPGGGVLESPVSSLADAVNFGLFIIAATTIALLVGRNHRVNVSLHRQVERLQLLSRMYHATLDNYSRDGALEALHREVSRVMQADVMFFLPRDEEPDKPLLAWRPDDSVDVMQMQAVAAAWTEGRSTGMGTRIFPDQAFRYCPLITKSNVIGVMAIRVERSLTLDRAGCSLLNSVADLAALILERIMQGQAMEAQKLHSEQERLRSTLLSSVSHDLKTPLASIIGSLSVFRSMQNMLPEDQKKTLIDTAVDEAHRLDSFITNILDMTKIESGSIAFKKQWVRPEEMLRELRRRLRERLREHPLVELPSPEVEVYLDRLMIEQVLQNVLDNAAKYTPDGKSVEIGWQTDKEDFLFIIRDHGPGIPEEQREKIFDKYARLRKGDSKVAGTGLGLAISRAILVQHEGKITVENHPQEGAVFTIRVGKWRALIQNAAQTHSPLTS